MSRKPQQLARDTEPKRSAETDSAAFTAAYDRIVNVLATALKLDTNEWLCQSSSIKKSLVALHKSRPLTKDPNNLRNPAQHPFNSAVVLIRSFTYQELYGVSVQDEIRLFLAEAVFLSAEDIASVAAGDVRLADLLKQRQTAAIPTLAHRPPPRDDAPVLRSDLPQEVNPASEERVLPASQSSVPSGSEHPKTVTEGLSDSSCPATAGGPSARLEEVPVPDIHAKSDERGFKCSPMAATAFEKTSKGKRGAKAKEVDSDGDKEQEQDEPTQGLGPLDHAKPQLAQEPNNVVDAQKEDQGVRRSRRLKFKKDAVIPTQKGQNGRRTRLSPRHSSEEGLRELAKKYQPTVPYETPCLRCARRSLVCMQVAGNKVNACHLCQRGRLSCSHSATTGKPKASKKLAETGARVISRASNRIQQESVMLAEDGHREERLKKLEEAVVVLQSDRQVFRQELHAERQSFTSQMNSLVNALKEFTTQFVAGQFEPMNLEMKGADDIQGSRKGPSSRPYPGKDGSFLRNLLPVCQVDPVFSDPTTVGHEAHAPRTPLRSSPSPPHVSSLIRQQYPHVPKAIPNDSSSRSAYRPANPFSHNILSGSALDPPLRSFRMHSPSLAATSSTAGPNFGPNEPSRHSGEETFEAMETRISAPRVSSTGTSAAGMVVGTHVQGNLGSEGDDRRLDSIPDEDCSIRAEIAQAASLHGPVMNSQSFASRHSPEAWGHDRPATKKQPMAKRKADNAPPVRKSKRSKNDPLDRT